MTKLYQHTDTGVQIINRIAEDNDIRITLNIIDLWTPLLGTDVLGFYVVLKRLSFGDGRTRHITVRHLMDASHKDDRSIAKFTEILREFQFINTITPDEQQRRAGKSIVYILESPPRSITSRHIAFAKEQGWTPKRKDWEYKTLVPWMTEKEELGIPEEEFDGTKFRLSEISDSDREISDSSMEISDSNAEISDLNVVTNVVTNEATNKDIPSKNGRMDSDANALSLDDDSEVKIDPHALDDSDTEQAISAAEQARRNRMVKATQVASKNKGKIATVANHTSGKTSISDTGTDSLEAYIAEMIRRETGRAPKHITQNQSDALGDNVRISPTTEGPSPRKVWSVDSWRSTYKRYIDTKVPEMLREKNMPLTMKYAITILHWRYTLHQFFALNGQPEVYPDPNASEADIKKDNQFAGLNWSDFAEPVIGLDTPDDRGLSPEELDAELKEWGLEAIIENVQSTEKE